MPLGSVFSGEPLPVAPRTGNAELDAFHRKVLDYLRRLGALLARFVDTTGGGEGTPSDSSLPVISLYIGTDDQDLSGTYNAIGWTNTLWIDEEAFEHSADVVSVVTDGLYLVLCDIETLSGGFYENSVVLEISKPDGSAVFYPRMGYGKMDRGTFSLSLTLPLLAGRRVRVLARCPDYPETDGIKAEGTRLSIVRLRSSLGTNAGEGWNDDDGDGVPDEWGLAQL